MAGTICHFGLAVTDESQAQDALDSGKGVLRVFRHDRSVCKVDRGVQPQRGG
jgi:hypothetical protein